MTLHTSIPSERIDKELARAAPTDPRRPIRTGFAILVGFFGVLGGAAALIPISSAAIARGVVSVRGNRQTLQAAQSGVVSELDVRDGDRVVKGQLLVKLDDKPLKTELDDLTTQWDSLSAQEDRLIAERDDAPVVRFKPALLGGGAPAIAQSAMRSQQALFDQRRREFRIEQAVAREKIGELSVSRQGSLEGVAGSRRQLALIGEELQGVRTLYARGLSPKTRLLALERSAAQLTAEQGAGQSQVAEKAEAIDGARLELAKTETDRLTSVTEQLRQTELQLIELQPRVAAAEIAYDQTRLRAPASGDVLGLRVFTVGAVLAPGQEVLEVVPSHAPLIVQAEVQPGDIGDVRPGQTADVRLTDAKQGGPVTETGTVETVSADRLTDPANATAYYLVRVRLDPAMLRRAHLHLHPGMPAQVFIRTRNRTVLGYLLGPLIEQISHTFREN